MPSTANIDTVDPGAVDELERLWKLVDRFRTEVHFGGLWLKDDPFTEMRERIAAGKTTMDDDPPVVEGDEPIPIAEYVAYDKGLLEIEAAALAWIIDARDAYESTDRDTLRIPAELAAAACKYAEKEGADA